MATRLVPAIMANSVVAEESMEVPAKMANPVAAEESMEMACRVAVVQRAPSGLE